MRIRAMAIRILSQIRNDRRTLVLMFGAPLVLLTLLNVVLNSMEYLPRVGVVNAPQSYVESLYENNAEVVRVDEQEAAEMLESGEIIAWVKVINKKLYVEIDGSNTNNSNQTLRLLENARMSSGANLIRQDMLSEVNYVYGTADLENFDNFGSAMIGILIFFFVFLISGISFLQERTSGTLEKLLSTPIQRKEIVMGYMLGFGVITSLQAVIMTAYAIYVLGIMMIGSIWLVLLIALLSALTALAMGILASTLANNEFQVVQFIPLVIVPQIIFSGIFTMSGFWGYVCYAMPLYYVAEALRKVMIRGAGIDGIAFELAVIVLFCIVIIMIIIQTLKKYRRI